MFRKVFSLFLGMSFLAITAAAQMPAGKVTQVNVNKPKPGMEKQYEQARVRHMGWHRSQHDTWTWYVLQVMTGDGTGNYILVTPGHEWKDFDTTEKFQLADEADFAASVGPTLAFSANSYYTRRTDIGYSPAAEPGKAAPAGPAKYVQVIHFFLKPEGLNDFVEAAKKIDAAFQKTNTPRNRATFYNLVSGGRGPELVLVQDRNSFSDFDLSGKTLDQVMQEAYGDDGANTLKTLRQSYHDTYSEFLRYRPDLSYIPPAK